METIKATVVEIENKHFIEVGEKLLSIPISEDAPNEVKNAFNKLISLIKDREFQIRLEELGEDLFSNVANEYITQLNREILEVREEMIDSGLITTEKSKGSVLDS